MRAWFLLSLDESERLYQGNLGYADDLRRVYKYDSFVPNHKQVGAGDIAVVRGKKLVYGSAVIERLAFEEGLKEQCRCPSCNTTKIKERHVKQPRYRCECSFEFDEPKITQAPCVLYEADFGDTFVDFDVVYAVDDFWAIAPNLNKQHAILELDIDVVRTTLIEANLASSHPDQLPPAATKSFYEGKRTTVSVNRYERNPKAREACIAFYGCKCAACGFQYDQRYGEIGEGVIEVHHLVPLSKVSEGYQVDPINDLRPLCANCHTIAHKKNPPLTIDQLKKLIGQDPEAGFSY